MTLANGRLRPIPRESLSERAYQALRSALMLSHLKPGEKLQLRPLAAQLGISATPVREALLRLVSEQALQMDERGTVVVPSIGRARFLEIRRLRCRLEGEAAAAAAAHATPEAIAALEAIHDRMAAAEAAGDFAAAVQANEQFHFGLCRLARMPVLLGLVEILWMQCGPLLGHLYAEAPPYNGHRDALAALRRGDAEGVRAAMIRDIEEGGRPLLAFLDQAASRPLIRESS
ncbi:GntR family transcriptional regulator [Teichococcus oryzae]|uniref:GntR family transcriptional regulator n=1 Tax=Teichococcus oryzae TaxID=1608942 RepID=A0A5B2TH12_9PROT|nr:GntR family transcriptional regulator [Pseudoroseomonas oryzae]KAA2213489.1 GntR family transcriptional regulator [Pseudoroseomonas oryzae]